MELLNNQTSTKTIPWVEKYRPSKFDEIVLSDINKTICENIICMDYFPNLLFYGPPGTGKTTTIINLINTYQKSIMGKHEPSLMIHLNASDDRGIDIIRNQILQFVNSKCLFTNGLKFVILDEVDYMTKNAQQALRYLISIYSKNVRFCLICNYISRIDNGLQTELLKIRFNNLPEDKIYSFLKNILKNENSSIPDETIHSIQKMYGSDIRSMINFIQCNHNTDLINNQKLTIINSNTWLSLTNEIKKVSKLKIRQNINRYSSLFNYLLKLTRIYNVTLKNIMKDYITYLIRDKKINVTPDFLNFVERLMHVTSNTDDKTYSNYAFSNLEKFIELL